mmetsp:Transcript_69909/g.166865  ORF Transcript_69909/g.166865 Transcript_69909/m.166865 type:complete len:287 (+) Transcript_69909:1268-2128(+)
MPSEGAWPCARCPRRRSRLLLGLLFLVAANHLDLDLGGRGLGCLAVVQSIAQPALQIPLRWFRQLRRVHDRVPRCFLHRLTVHQDLGTGFHTSGLETRHGQPCSSQAKHVGSHFTANAESFSHGLRGEPCVRPRILAGIKVGAYLVRKQDGCTNFILDPTWATTGGPGDARLPALLLCRWFRRLVCGWHGRAGHRHALLSRLPGQGDTSHGETRARGLQRHVRCLRADSIQLAKILHALATHRWQFHRLCALSEFHLDSARHICRNRQSAFPGSGAKFFGHDTEAA